VKPRCFSFPTEKARGRETNGGDVTRHPGRPNRLVIFRGPAPHGRGGQSQNSRDIHHLRLPPQQRPSVPHPTAGARPCRAHVGWPVCFFLSLLRRAEQGHVHGRSTRSGSLVLGLWTPASLRPGRVERDGAAARGTLPRRAASPCTRGVVSFFWGGRKAGLVGGAALQIRPSLPACRSQPFPLSLGALCSDRVPPLRCLLPRPTLVAAREWNC
jgi:hypothetical protein